MGTPNRSTSVTFSPDGTRALSGGDDNTLKLRDGSTGRLIRTFQGHTGEVRQWPACPMACICRPVLVVGIETPKLWDAETGLLIHNFEGTSEGCSVGRIVTGRHASAVRPGQHAEALGRGDGTTDADHGGAFR